METYSAMRRNEVLIHATTGMNLEQIILSERSQLLVPFIQHVWHRQGQRDRKVGFWVTRAWGLYRKGGNQELLRPFQLL